MWSAKPINILIVDDREDGLFALETILDCPEYRLVKANSGEQALKSLLHEDFALVLLDVQMPGMNGFETASLIRARKKSRYVPIIFVTAINKEDTFIDRGYEVGAVDYIFKPFNPGVLKSKVAVFVELYKKNLQLQRQAFMLQENERKIQAEKLVQLELQSLRRYENLANSIPHMVWRANSRGQMEYFNEGWHKFTGLTTKESLDKGWHSHIHPEDLGKWLNRWKHAIDENENHFETECRIRNCMTLKYQWFLVRAISEFNTEGEIVSWLGTNTDIQEQKEADKKKAAFLSIASHEFKTPLTAVNASLEAALQLIHEFNITSENKTTLNAINTFLTIGLDSSNNINTLLDDFLDFSRMESGKLPIKVAKISLSDLVSKAVQGHSAKMSTHKHLKLSSSIEENIVGIWDPYRLRQVLDNLISNAIKYSPNEGVIDVTLVRENDTASIYVKDQGIGIGNLDHKKIFKPFARSSGAKHYGGLGIGLYISAWIVEEHQGRIDVDSEEGKGSIFKIQLPIRNGEVVRETHINH